MLNRVYASKARKALSFLFTLLYFFPHTIHKLFLIEERVRGTFRAGVSKSFESSVTSALWLSLCGRQLKEAHKGYHLDFYNYITATFIPSLLNSAINKQPAQKELHAEIATSQCI